jgi:hypothetical protein
MDKTPRMVIPSNLGVAVRHHFQVNGPVKPGLGFGDSLEGTRQPIVTGA